MHGVKLVSTPPTKTTGIALSGLPDRLGRRTARSMMHKATAQLGKWTMTASATAILAATAWFPCSATAQSGSGSRRPPVHGSMSDSMRMSGMADDAMGGSMDANMMKHMELTPGRVATHADSVRATKLVAELRQ